MKKQLLVSIFALCASLAPLFAGNDENACPYPEVQRTQQAHERQVAEDALVAHKTVYSMNLSERAKLRRLWLDITGTLPAREMVDEYLASEDPNKWSQMVDYLLGTEEYVARWTTFFNDMFLNHNLSFSGVVRNRLNNKLREMIAENKPVNEMIRDVLSTRGRTAFNGESNFFYLKEALVGEFRLDYLDDQVGFMTETVLGVKTTCISCHDGAYHLEEVNKGLSTMTREQFWGMAAFLSKTHFIIERGNTNIQTFEDFLKATFLIDLDVEGFDSRYETLLFTSGFRDRRGEYDATSQAGDGMRPARAGGIIQPRYLTTGAAPADGESRREALARLLTSDRQFARNIVNRVWAHFMGEGFVNPVDDWDLGRINAKVAGQNGTTVQPKTAKLMEWLIDRFIDSGYDLKQLVRTVSTGPAVFDGAMETAGTWPGVSEWRKNRKPRRLAAEAVLDAFYKIHRVTPRLTVTSMLDRTFTNPWEMPGPNEPNIFAIYNENFDRPPADVFSLGYRSLDEYYFFQDFTQSTMQAFNRGQYELGTARSSESSIQNALTFLNDQAWNFWMNLESPTPFVQAMVNALNEQVDSETVATVMFQEVLFRDPTEEELAHVVGYIQQKTNDIAVRDLLWALFNHPDFLYK